MLYSIYSTKRSGHHAFIEWLCKNLSGRWVYLNNIKIPNGEVSFVKAETSIGIHVPGGSVVGFLNEYKEMFDYVVMSYENITDEQLKVIYCFEEKIKARFSLQQIRITHVRDFFNSFASQFSWFEKSGKEINKGSTNRFKKSWRLLAGAFIHESPYFGRLLGKGVLTSFYSGFCFEEKYRDGLANILDIPNNPLRQDLSKFGGGGNTFFSNPEDYKVEKGSLESRWKFVGDIETFVDLIDQDTLILAKEFADKIGRPDLYSVPFENLFRVPHINRIS